MVLKFLYLARIGRSDILWSVYKLARADKKLTRASDTRWTGFISKIHLQEFLQTSVMLEILHNSAEWDYSEILILNGILKTHNRLRVEDTFFWENL